MRVLPSLVKSRFINSNSCCFLTQSTKPLDSSCEAEADYAEPVDVLSRADSRDRNTANTSVQFGNCKFKSHL